MPDASHPAPQGAARVNDELEIGADPRFEGRWHRAELTGRMIVILVVAAGLAGLLGRGPFSHRTATLPGGGLAVDFEPIARSGAVTQVTLHIRPPSIAMGQGEAAAVVHLPSEIVEPLGLETIAPRPVRQWAERGGIALEFALADRGADNLIRLTLRPDTLGPHGLTARVDDGPTLLWTQVVLP